VTDAGVRAGDLVLDVGAGRGALTAPLVDIGARVIAVELHPGRAAYLRDRFGARIVLVRADAHALRLPTRPYKVVANPPFDVTTPLIRRLLQPGSRMLNAQLLLQEQAARRWSSADAPGANRWRRDFDATLGRPVPRAAFAPRPAVNCRVLTLTRRPL
jgi:23S rRNA (adenine-N6)-dimethyltransferase